MNEIRQIEAAQMKPSLDEFYVGDTVKVHFKIIEGTTERIQMYEGLVIAIKNAGVGRTFTVRKNSYGVGVERVFPVHSPKIARLEVTRPGRVRRAKLYYIRDKIGKGAKIKELLGPKAVRRRAAVPAAPVQAEAPVAAEAGGGA
jgi:large subunit ribosomal protein L19